ncbi:biotin/lipoyl-containing protein [Tropicimonas sp. IMCC34043]|uniref:biotin/lipoyl-containing protein n=1 Tax=Tropicimonas sp. IMCC34043 TaxID=2248760 RepID=UPI000E2300AC|nr:biotin/lipoyl-containing protein [Tropicimonas sp. IMCC34043]
MPRDVIMPALGMAQDTGLIVAWHKAPGDAVAEGDVLFEVETDKATMEVAAEANGYLTDVASSAGEDVPVGQVIARISATPEDSGTAAAPAAAEPDADLPEGQGVIMPTLGMAQDSGLIVAWHKAPGDAVAADDVLFEVETDKSTVEVAAGVDGFVAALLAEAGEDIPVGETIAIIAEKAPASPIARRFARSAAPETTPVAPAEAPPKPPVAEPPVARPATAPRDDGRILASPKARRLALEQGLDLARLVAAGHPQPFHVKDLEVLRALPVEAAQTQTPAQAAARRLTAEIPSEGFTDFAGWAAGQAGLKDEAALLAGLAGASLSRDGAIVAVEAFGRILSFAVPAGGFGAVTPADPDAAPDLHLRDLRFSRIGSVHLGAEPCPVLTLVRAGAGLSLTLECASHHLTPAEALSLLSEFAGRMEQPLRHLL